MTLKRQFRSWARRQMYSLFSSIGTLMSHKLATMMTVLVLGIAMALPLGLYVSVKNLRALDLQQEDWGTITVFLDIGIVPSLVELFRVAVLVSAPCRRFC